MRVLLFTTIAAGALLGGCWDSGADAPTLAHRERVLTLRTGECRPPIAEVEASGPIGAPIRRGSSRFARLVESHHRQIAFKDEERTGADRIMSVALRLRVHRLESLVAKEWRGTHLRVTEAWDENAEHSAGSLHYEGRAADMTTSDRDPQKLGRLAGLAVEAGFDWVIREPTHVHASVR